MQLYLRQPFWRWDNCGNILSPLDVPIMLPNLLNYPSRFGQDELVAWFHFWDSKKQGLSVLLLISHQQNFGEVFSTQRNFNMSTSRDSFWSQEILFAGKLVTLKIQVETFHVTTVFNVSNL